MVWTQELVGMVIGAILWNVFIVVAIITAACGIYAIVMHLRGVLDWEERSFMVSGVMLVLAGFALAVFLWYLTLPGKPAAPSQAAPTPISISSPDF